MYSAILQRRETRHAGVRPASRRASAAPSPSASSFLLGVSHWIRGRRLSSHPSRRRSKRDYAGLMKPLQSMERYSDDERRSMRTQETRPGGVAAAQARLLCRSSLAYRIGYAAVVASGAPVAGAMGRRSCGAAIAATAHVATGSRNFFEG